MKKLLIFLLTLTFLGLGATQTQAISIESQSEKSATSQTFILLAEPPTDSTALQMRLSVTGGSITSFSASNDGILSIGTCDNENTEFTESKVCVDLASVVATFDNGDVLGVLTVERDDPYTQLVITKDEDNAYLNASGELVEDSGTAFTLYGNTTTTTTSNGNNYVFLLILLITLLVGVVLGTTFTTLSHVYMHEKANKKK